MLKEIVVNQIPFDAFNPYHLNIKPTLEQYPERVLDNEIITENK